MNYIASDQEYVLKGFVKNIEENFMRITANPSMSKRKGNKRKKQPRVSKSGSKRANGTISTQILDWELDDFTSGSTIAGNEPDADELKGGLDAVIACDCVYNESLISPLVRTCVNACQTKPESVSQKRTICLIAQQIRSSDVFCTWLQAFHTHFRVWRMPDELLTQGLKEGSGFVIHLGILRDGPTDGVDD
ncbi:MAG: hypothetical protein M1837_001664 [Sclerophora amabilis]|nr:MAG: hypothetical protein M1837_001664 [Sclerophora amabilis]